MRFFLKLLPPRPSFAADMSAEERAVMERHIAYWRTFGPKVIVIGPVLDPRGAYGIAVVEAADEAEARSMISGDPVSKAEMGRYEVYRMGGSGK